MTTAKKPTKKENVESSPEDIYSIEDIPGLGDVSIKKLHDNDIHTKRDMLVRSWIELSDITGTDRNKVAVMVEFCRNQLQKHEDQWATSMTATEMLEKRKVTKSVKTLSPNLNELIGGGFEEKCVTEIAGGFHSGKTQMAMHIALRSLLPEKDGGFETDPKNPVRVLYFDVERTFRPERLIEMATSSKQATTDEEIKKILGSFDIKRPEDPAHLILLLEKVSPLIRNWNYKVLVIDSGAALFRQEMSEMGNAGRKFRLMNTMVRLLGNLAEYHNLCVIYINQVYDSMDGFGDPTRRYGGNVVGHAMTYRLTVRKAGKKWVATTTDFPHLPEEDSEFMITSKGIEDKKK